MTRSLPSVAPRKTTGDQHLDDAVQPNGFCSLKQRILRWRDKLKGATLGSLFPWSGRHIVTPHVRLPEAVAQVFVTDTLWARSPSDPDYRQEKLALQDLAQEMVERPKELLSRLVELAIQATGAESSGLSILEPDGERFRWFGLKGVLKVFEDATTPRNDSPCGVCLDHHDAVLMDRPERAYSWIRDANISVPEVLLVPLRHRDGAALGTLWVVSAEPGLFNPSHVRVMKELAAFAALALHMVQTEERLNSALHEQEMLTREMSHRVKNLFAVTSSMIGMTERNATSKEDLADQLRSRLQALAGANALVRRSFANDKPEAVVLEDLLQSILKPYQGRSITVKGPSVAVGERSINNVALIFYELATNAAKYGALKVENGSLAVDWTIDDESITLTWTEADGPVTKAPDKLGFGSRLVQATVKALHGQFDYEWCPEGLVARMTAPLQSLKA
jgi:two-component sensor histidine kinase